MAENPEQQPLQNSLPPQVQALLAAGMPAAPGNQPTATPAAAPTGAPPASVLGPTSPFDLAKAVSSVSALPEYSGPSADLQRIGGQEEQVRQSMASMPVPKMGPQIQPGAGFFRNLGQALLMLASATKPGQAANAAIYGPGISQYRTKQAGLARQLDTLKGEEAIPTEELRATTGLAQAAGLANYRSGMLGVKQEQTDIQRDRVTAYQQSINDRAQNFVATQDWRSASLDEKKRSNVINEAQRAADEAGRNFREQHRDATTEEVAQIVTGTKQQIANEAAARDPGVKSWLFNALSIDVPQIQGAPSPEFRPTPTATPATPTKPAQGKAVPKGTTVYDPQGRAHISDGTHPLPQGWSLSKKK